MFLALSRSLAPSPEGIASSKSVATHVDEVLGRGGASRRAQRIG